MAAMMEGKPIEIPSFWKQILLPFKNIALLLPLNIAAMKPL